MLLSLAIILAFQSTHVLAALDPAALTKQHFGNDSPWYLDRIPLFESSDPDITKVYYYRWSIFRSHQRDLGSLGFISTEFLNDVSWQINPWASLNDATGFHLLEGRWCRDLRYKNDYASFIFSPDSSTRQFSETMADGVWKGYLVDGDAGFATSLLPEMMAVFDAWEDSFDETKGLYWVEPLRDATEYTISSIDASGGIDGFTGGDAFRPSINSYQYANALAIAKLAALNGSMDDTETTYRARAAAIKGNMQISLWNSTFEHFIDRHYLATDYVYYWEPIRGRELVGYVPWAHDLPDDTVEYAQAWSHILNTTELLGPYGHRTVEPSYEYYMIQYRYDVGDGNPTLPECQWNGPMWPYQTTQVLTGLANLLDHYPNATAANVIGKSDYVDKLRQYAQLHYNKNRNGTLDIQEDYYPDTGAPIDWLGFGPRDDDVLEVNPAADSSITYFRAKKILYHGREIAVQYDIDGSHYGTPGLQIEINGIVVASSLNLTRLQVPLEKKANPIIERPIALSIQLQSTTAYPIGRVSIPNTDPARIHDAIDGRIFFYPEIEVLNGWNTPVGNGSEVWYQIDFGNVTTTRRAEIAFFKNEMQGYDVPVKYRFQVDGMDVKEGVYGEVVGNGVTCAGWEEVEGESVRLVFRPKVGMMVRLVEVKIF